MKESIEDVIVSDVAETGYHPRTSQHSDRQSLIIIRDILAGCPIMAQRAKSGELVAKLHHHQQVGHNDWQIDIAIGTCAGSPIAPAINDVIRLTEPAIIQVAIELKSIWTEHGKARRNRLRDFNAFHSYAHDYGRETIAVAFLVVNGSDYFLSPLNLGKSSREEISRHFRKSKPAAALVKETIGLFRSIHLRNHANDLPGMEALGVVVVEHDNICLHPNPSKYEEIRRPTRAAPVPPGLRVGDPLHYHTMLQRICIAYKERFG
jgi:hypothetical protein